MFKGMQHLPQFQLGAPVMPDFSQANLTSYEDFVKPNAKPAPPIGARLLAARFQMVRSGAAQETIAECDALLGQFCALEKRLEEFLVDSRSKHVATLGAKREDLWTACRAAEDAEKAARYQVGSIQARINSQSEEANSARSKADAAKQNPYNTRFPSTSERDEWALKRARAQQEAHVAMATLQGTQVELSAAQANHHEAAKQLESLVEQLRGVDSELNNIR